MEWLVWLIFFICWFSASVGLSESCCIYIYIKYLCEQFVFVSVCICVFLLVGRHPCATCKCSFLDCVMCVCVFLFVCLFVQGASSVRHRCVLHVSVCVCDVGFQTFDIQSFGFQKVAIPSFDFQPLRVYSCFIKVLLSRVFCALDCCRLCDWQCAYSMCSFLECAMCVIV